MKPSARLFVLTVSLVASACGGSSSGGTGRLPGGDAGPASGGASSGGTAGSSNGGSGTGGRSGSGGAGGSAGLGAGGFIACPPCAAPPRPNCVGSGPCGCGPYTCDDAGPPAPTCGTETCGGGTSCCGPAACGHCVPSTSGVFCPDYCEFCAGAYRKTEYAGFCQGPRTTLWEVTTNDVSPFLVPDCQDAATNVPRYCCTADFRPTCP
ncbi:MAG TPA: hypothetical protein VHE30_15995 [Polyangiaceae bacterium]|nr:hypothetical protein [Polyangiaceae bacterium]